MPGISGAHLATALREICGEELVLIAMSASPPDEATIRDDNVFLLKPSRWSNLLPPSRVAV